MLSKSPKHLLSNTFDLDVRDYFNTKVAKYGKSVQALGWQSVHSQYLRYYAFTQSIDLENVSVLDVGCGFGDLLTFLNENNIHSKYTGLDISSAMVELAKIEHPKAEFILDDMLNPKFNKQFDVIVSIGAFNLKMDGNVDMVKKVMTKCFQLAYKGVSFSLLSEHAKEGKDESTFYYYSPSKIMTFAQTLTPFVELKHHYLKHDFLITLYK